MTTEWQYDNKGNEKPEVFDRDFKRLNKMALSRRVTTANQQSKFRRATDAQHMRIGHPHMQQTRSARRSCYAVGLTLDPRQLDQAFGRANRPPTPMGDVMANQYQNDAVQMQSLRNSMNEKSYQA